MRDGMLFVLAALLQAQAACSQARLDKTAEISWRWLQVPKLAVLAALGGVLGGVVLVAKVLIGIDMAASGPVYQREWYYLKPMVAGLQE